MASSSLDIADYTCSICREIFDCPVSLQCGHNYCDECVHGLIRSDSGSETESEEDIELAEQSEEPLSHGDTVEDSQIHHAEKCFQCAICRKLNYGYKISEVLQLELQQQQLPCSICGEQIRLSELRKHNEQESSAQKNIKQNQSFQTMLHSFSRQLSESQANALQKAQTDSNRSTFKCPFCSSANLTSIDLCDHIEKNHLTEDQQKVCPVCAAQPWGNSQQRSHNLYQHIRSRHYFDYSTFVNYDIDEEQMLAEALRQSRLEQ